MYLIMCVIHDADKSQRLIDAWEKAGVSGITLLHSTGLGRIRNHILMDDLPLIPSLETLMEHEEYFSRTLFSVVEQEGIVDRVVEATQEVIGDLSKPDTGLLVIVPVVRAYGLNKQR